MNWAMPQAPADEQAFGFHCDSCSIWAARIDAGIPDSFEAFFTSSTYSSGTSPDFRSWAPSPTPGLSAAQSSPEETSEAIPTTPSRGLRQITSTATPIMVHIPVFDFDSSNPQPSFLFSGFLTVVYAFLRCRAR